MNTYTVESPIKHDGKEYAEGDTIELNEKDAKDLLEIGAVSGPVEGAHKTLTLTDEERLAAIVEAISTLDQADTTLWLASGAPKAEAIAAITGWKVSAAERDAVWMQGK